MERLRVTRPGKGEKGEKGKRGKGGKGEREEGEGVVTSRFGLKKNGLTRIEREMDSKGLELRFRFDSQKVVSC